MSKQPRLKKAVYEAEQRLKGSFLDDLLEGRPSVRRQLAATASYLGHSFSQVSRSQSMPTWT